MVNPAFSGTPSWNLEKFSGFRSDTREAIFQGVFDLKFIVIISVLVLCLFFPGGDPHVWPSSDGRAQKVMAGTGESRSTVSITAPDDVIEEGNRLVKEAGCRGCHRIEGYGALHAPSLDWKGNRYRQGWLEQYIRNPYRMRPFLDLMMPDYTSSRAHRPLSAEEIDIIATYLSLLATRESAVRDESAEPLEERPCYSCHSEIYMKTWTPYRRTKIPEDVIKTIDSKPSLLLCLSCHILGDLGRKMLKPSRLSGYRMAPDLIHSVKKNRIEWIINYTGKVEHKGKKTGMPYLSLPDLVLNNIRKVFGILRDRVRSKGSDRLEVQEERYFIKPGGSDVSK